MSSKSNEQRNRPNHEITVKYTPNSQKTTLKKQSARNGIRTRGQSANPLLRSTRSDRDMGQG